MASKIQNFACELSHSVSLTVFGWLILNLRRNFDCHVYCLLSCFRDILQIIINMFSSVDSLDQKIGLSKSLKKRVCIQRKLKQFNKAFEWNKMAMPKFKIINWRLFHAILNDCYCYLKMLIKCILIAQHEIIQSSEEFLYIQLCTILELCYKEISYSYIIISCNGSWEVSCTETGFWCFLLGKGFNEFRRWV